MKGPLQRYGQRYGQRLLGRMGLTVSRTHRVPPDLDAATVATIAFVQPYTMTTPERIHALCHSVRYVADNRIPGAIAECGVWRGGSMMAAARTLIEAADATRPLYLYDTFDGMVRPGPHDAFGDGTPATAIFDREIRASSNSKWCDASLPDVRAAMTRTGYPRELVHYVPGRVEQTLPGTSPGPLAILRLDTDWYESTLHELVCLFPLLQPGGVLIIDDYGHWRGAQKAVDEYFETLGHKPMLTRIDYGARIAVLPGWPRNQSEGGPIGEVKTEGSSVQ